MQGAVSLETAQEFMGQFFIELRRDGQIDRAVAVSRSRVKTATTPGWPSFTRLSSGRLWSVASEASESRFNRWDGLLNRIAQGRCTPILGARAHRVLARLASTGRSPLGGRIPLPDGAAQSA